MASRADAQALAVALEHFAGAAVALAEVAPDTGPDIPSSNRRFS